MARRSLPPATLVAPPRAPLWAALAIGVAGMVLAGVLARLHQQAHAGIASFCAINDVVNCDRVAVSRYSVVLGIPVALWGLLGYAIATALAAAGLFARRRPHPAFPVGLLFLHACAANAAAVALGLVSHLLIGAWCLLCIGSWVLTAALLAVAWLACRDAGVRASIAADLGALRARLGRVLLLAAAALLAVTAAGAALPRYWERKAPPPAKPGPAAPALTATAPVLPVAPGVTVVVEYSDYDCPFCAKAHQETRDLRAARPDVTFVRRHFPLDMTCNPLLKRQMHAGACLLASAAVCAEAQGRFAEMDDALFENQQARVPVQELARRLGLDPEAFQACLGAPATAQRIASDVAAAARDGVKATPSYVINGVARTGSFPTELLPPR